MTKKVAIIIGVALVVFAIVVVIVSIKKPNNKEISDIQQSLPEIGQESLVPDSDGTVDASISTPPGMNEEITVAFYVEGKLRGIHNIYAGQSVYPEESPSVPNKVFQGWDIDLWEVWETTSTNAMFTDVSSLDNCFALESAYSNEEQLATMNVLLCGNVNIASTDFIICYNVEDLTLEDILNLDDGVLVNHNAETGEIRCSLLSYDNITGSIDLMQLQFSVSGTGNRESAVTLTVEDAAMLNGEDIIDAQTNVVDGKVFILKEFG